MKLKPIRDLFFEKLDEKTGWGKEQVKRLFDDIVSEFIELDCGSKDV